MSSRSRCGLRGMTDHEPGPTTTLDRTSETEPLPWKRARDLLDAPVRSPRRPPSYAPCGPTLAAVRRPLAENRTAEVSRDGPPYDAPGTGPPPCRVYRVAAESRTAPHAVADRYMALWNEPDADRRRGRSGPAQLLVRGRCVMATVEANGVTLGVEHFGDAAAPLVLLAGGTTMLALRGARSRRTPRRALRPARLRRVDDRRSQGPDLHVA